VLSDLAAAGATVVHDRYHLYDNPAFATTQDTAQDAAASSVPGVLQQLCFALV
jgi:hypothetical protein